MTSNRPKQLSRREMLRLMGFGGSLVLSACVGQKPTKPSLEPPTSTSAANAGTTSSNAQAVSPAPHTETPQLESEIQAPTTTPSLEERFTEILTPLDLAPLPDEAWKELPIIPEVLSERMLKVFNIGQQFGRNPREFSVIGDCTSNPVFFLKNFDDPPPNPRYNLGEDYAYLQETIDYYKGSFNNGVGYKNGMNVSSLFSPFWADPTECRGDQGPLACELAYKNSVFVFFSIQKNWFGTPEEYSQHLETVIAYTIRQGVIPVLGTKAHNLEGDHSIDRAVVEVARRYELPLWNYWAAVKDLPRNGLEPDLEHLSLDLNTYYDYSAPENFNSGWTLRNFTALLMLDFLRRSLQTEVGLGAQMLKLFTTWLLGMSS